MCTYMYACTHRYTHMNTCIQKTRLKNLLGLVVHVMILALGKRRKEDQGFKVILSYIGFEAS